MPERNYLMNLITDLASILDLIIGLSEAALFVSLTLLSLRLAKRVAIETPVVFGRERKKRGSLIFHQLLKLGNLLGIHKGN